MLRKFFGNGSRELGGRYIDTLLEVFPEDAMIPTEVADTWPKIFVPEHEFVKIVNDLPEFRDLCFTWLNWNQVNCPTQFIVECFDIDERLAIDTSGYEYPRYKGVICE